MFYLTNFQFMVTSLSFSISKPFKKSIFSNKLLMASIIILLMCDITLLIVPPTNPIYWTLFHCLKFEKDGVTYYKYYWLIVGCVVLNSILTYVAEKLIIDKVTVNVDKNNEARNLEKFHKEMDLLWS